MNTYIETRAIEIHDTQTMWNPQKMKKIVDFMVRYHMNTLILHENDIVDKVVFPAMLYTSEKTDGNIYGIYQKIYEKIYEMTPSPFVFCDEKGIFVELLRKIIRDATSRGIRVFLQTKELWHSDLLYHSPVATTVFCARRILSGGSLICPQNIRSCLRHSLNSAES